MNNGEVFAVYDYHTHRSDELDFSVGTRLAVLRCGDDFEMEWWWWCQSEKDGYVPHNLLGLYPMFNLVDPNQQQQKSLTEQTSSLLQSDLKNTSEEDEDVALSF